MADGSYVNQRIVVRLRRDQLDESRVLADYEARSELLGRADHDYIRHLILIGHLFVSKIGSAVPGNSGEHVALSTNESDNTGKERAPSIPSNESKADSKAPETAGDPQPEEVVGSAIRQMAGIFGGKNKTS